VEYTPSGGSAQTVLTGSTSTNYTVTGLTTGIAHQFRVAAVNGIGNGSYSSAVTATPAATTRLSATGYTGAGTAADPLAPPTSPSQFENGPQINVLIGGTATIATRTVDTYGDDRGLIIMKNSAMVLYWSVHDQRTVTFPVVAGDRIRLLLGDDGAKWLSTTRLWVV
jgi:hypothetical protein